ncbi:MAG: helix-turn-helix domain-containing protein [Phycisphaerales bacterium]
MQTKGAPAELEARRLRAAELLGQGRGTSEVARLVGVTSSYVSKWKKALLRRWSEGLRARPHPGRKPRLNAVRKRRLEAPFKKGAVAAGLTEVTLTPKPQYIDAMTNWEDPLYRRIVERLPFGAKPSDYITSLDVSVMKR